MIHALSVDVEDYHNLLARHWLGREGPPTPAVADNTARILDLFDRHSARATFFFLGEVAATFPELVRRVAAAGHELGVHGCFHHLLPTFSPDQFRRDVQQARQAVQDAAGLPVFAHRAPAFSIGPHTAWALDVLAELGFHYDSSIYPIHGRRYGWPGFRPDIHRLDLTGGRSLIEVPLTTIRVLAWNLPVCGGGYLRHFPLAWTRWALRRVQRQRPVVVYLHPYDIEWPVAAPDTAGVDVRRARAARCFHRRQLCGRRSVEPKLRRLLTEFRFAPLRDVIAQVLPDYSPAGTPAPSAPVRFDSD